MGPKCPSQKSKISPRPKRNWFSALNHSMFQNSRSWKSIPQVSVFGIGREFKTEGYVLPLGIQFPKVQPVHSGVSLPLMGLSPPQTVPLEKCNRPAEYLGWSLLKRFTRNDPHLLFSIELKCSLYDKTEGMLMQYRGILKL